MDENNHFSETPPVSPDPQPEYAPHKAKHSSRPLLILLLCVIVAVLAAAAGALGYKYLYPQKTTETAASTATTSSQPSNSATANTLINGLKSQLKSPTVPTEIDGNNNVVVIGTVYGVDGAPDQKPSGSNFFTTPATFPRVTVASTNSDTLMNDVQTAEAYFLNQHLQLDTVNYNGAESGITAQFHNATTVCSLSQTTEPWPQGSNQLTVNCADMSAYQSQAATLAPLYKAYVAAQPNAKGVVGPVFTGSITASQTKGYHTASIGTGSAFSPVGGSAALFYQTPDGTWHYFQNTQSILSCSAYNTNDLKKAFAGTTCDNGSSSGSKVAA